MKLRGRHRGMARVLAVGVLPACALGLLPACSGDDAAEGASTSRPPTDSPSVAPSSTGPSTGGEAMSDAEFEVWLRRKLALPALPSFSVPVEVFADARDKEVATQLAIPPGLYEGIAVVDARCTDRGAVAADASGITRGRDGSGTFDDGAVAIVVEGDGSGTYRDATRRIEIESDGSGSYTDGAVSLAIESDGSGSYSDGMRTVEVDSDRSGRFSDDEIEVTVGSAGTASYRDHAGEVEVSANGTTTTSGDVSHADVVARVLAEGLPLFPPVPKIGALPEPAPGVSCGTVIRLDANVLFDFDRDSLRPEASDLLDRVGALLVALGSPPLRVDGHTDAVGGEAYNLDLSQRRAESVRNALVDRGVTASVIETRGLGESVPLVPETTPDGRDDPAARQRNRRVELVLLDG